MADILSLLSGPAEARHWQRSGMASCCRLACAALAQGRSSVILVRDREEYTAARALLPLFSPSLSLADMAPDVPAWKLPFAALPAGLLLRRDRDSWAGRLAALYGLAQGGPRCLILSTEALLLRHVPRDFFAEHTLDLTRGSDYPPELILDQAVEWGYERVPLVTRPGQMARRGDIFDIFPSGYPRPVRMEFFGDTLEELRLFDAESQRSLQGLDELTLLPALPFVLDAQGLAAARKRMDALFAGARISENDCYTFKKTLDAGGLGLLPGVVHEKASTIADWLPEEPLWFLPGQADCDAALHGTAMQLRDQLEEDDAPLPQPSALCLCGSLQDLPWEKARRFYLEPLVMGVDAVGDDVQERPLHAFTDLFPVPGAADRPWQHLSAGLKEWQNRRRQVVLSFSSQRSRAKFLKLAEQEGITPALRYAPDQRGLFALVSPWRSGAELVWDDVLVLGEDILYPRAEKKARASSRAFKGLDSFDDLKAGDLLVHRDYGIGRFAGLHHLVQGGQGNDFLLVEYSGQDRLY
ncbi:MAG: CarD family transcriptional regulator, partial [Desulfovibrio piger]|uniref:CarD family transcriptional regulator n=1 Tax=Desulfovibrio piger TaxID=901 RepID=UPI00399C0E8A